MKITICTGTANRVHPGTYGSESVYSPLMKELVKQGHQVTHIGAAGSEHIPPQTYPLDEVDVQYLRGSQEL